jgi:hypothetical protein
MEAGYICGNPACRNVITLEIHHRQYVSEHGGDDPSNLLVLCPYCHSMHHAGQIPVEAIRLWKGLLVALNQGFDRRGMDLLLFVHKTKDTRLWLSGDGVLAFAGLIGCGLVAIADTDVIFIAPGHPGKKFTQTSHKLALTLRGCVLVQAWLDGNEEQFRTLISGATPTTAASPS